MEISSHLTINSCLIYSLSLKSLALKGWHSLIKVLNFFRICAYCSFERVIDFGGLLLDDNRCLGRDLRDVLRLKFRIIIYLEFLNLLPYILNLRRRLFLIICLLILDCEPTSACSVLSWFDILLSLLFVILVCSYSF